MKPFCPKEGSYVREAMSKFDQDLERLEKNIRTLHQKMQPFRNHQGLDTVDCTETQSLEIEPESRKSIIDDLDTELLKQTSHTSYTNQLTAVNYIFEIKEQTEIDEISLGTSRTEFDFLKSQEEQVGNQQYQKYENQGQLFALPQSQPYFVTQPQEYSNQQKVFRERPKSSYAKLKDLMITQLNNSSVVETINISLQPKKIIYPQPFPINIHYQLPKYQTNHPYVISPNNTTNQHYFPAKKHIIYTLLK